MNPYDRIRLRQQATTAKPPSGYKDVRLNKTTGLLVLVDDDGTETPLLTTVVSADITDATDDASTTFGKVLKTNALSGGIYPKILATTNITVVGTGGSFSFGGSDLTSSYYGLLPNATGTMPVLPSYANNAAALTAGLAAGEDIYWDTTAKKAKVVQAGE